MQRVLLPTMTVVLFRVSVPMVSDGDCKQCGVKYTDGNKSKLTSGG